MHDELEHYGRLGMKWGQHIFGKEKAFNKSMRKLGRLDRKSKTKYAKSEAHSAKAEKYRSKKEQLENKFFFKFGPIDTFREKRLARKSYKYNKKAYRSLRSSQRAYRKAQNWVSSMNKVFQEVPFENNPLFSAENLELSRQYVIDVLEQYPKPK